MSEDLMVDDIEDSDEQENEAQLNELQQKLIKKCERADIESETGEFTDGGTFIFIGMPNGREKRLISFYSAEKIKKALSLDFEKYVCLGDYSAIANYEHNSIEAIIRPMNGAPRSFLRRRLFGENEDGDEIQPITLKETGSGQATIEISEATDVLILLSTRGPFRRQGTLSIKISGINISQHNKSLEILRRVTDSLFFQLDIQNGLTLSIARDRRPMRRPRKQGSEIDLEFPQVEFDKSPISLYWYARSAVGMPLLQFLAFYQVIEYYYPTYSQEEARRRVRSILKRKFLRNFRGNG